jgi:hypothetical protein
VLIVTPRTIAGAGTLRKSAKLIAHILSSANRRNLMASKRAKPTQESAIKRDLKTPKYQMRVVADKSKCKRQRDKCVRAEDFRKAA